ncbi:polysaccharide biosynthesis/export family protein [soil metagenome]
MNKNLFLRLFLCTTVSVTLFSCKTSRQLAYFQDLTDTAKVQLVEQYPFQPLKVQVDDQLQILVTSSSPEASQFFNISSGAVNAAAAALNAYPVTVNGNITLPIIGEMQVLGLTTLEVKQKVFQALTPYLKDAVVSVRIINFKITVIGEVSGPVVVPVDRERINVLEAIGAAGDMTVYSKRYNVKVLRKGVNGMEVAHLNFNYSKIMQSPYFQLQQNDVVYVEPETTKGISAERATILLPIIASVTSLALTLVAFLKL